MGGKPCRLMATMLLLVLPVGAQSMSPSPTASGAPAHTLELLGRWHGGPVFTSAVSGDHVFFGSGGAIRVLRIKDGTTAWQEVASIATSGVVRDLHATGSHLYVADDSGALRIIDISVAEQLNQIGHVNLPGSGRAVSVQGQYAYVAAEWSGLVVIDVSDPKRPRVAHTHKTPGLAVDVHVTGSLALVL